MCWLFLNLCRLKKSEDIDINFSIFHRERLYSNYKIFVLELSFGWAFKYEKLSSREVCYCVDDYVIEPMAFSVSFFHFILIGQRN